LKGIEHLRSIHFMMDKNERVALRNYLTCFESRKKGHKPKSLILLDLLEKYDDDGRVILLLKKKIASEDARRMVVSRLREKMLSSLTLDVNLTRSENYDEQAQARAGVIQGKLQGGLLLGRGQRKLGYFVIDRSIKEAKHYEFYDDLVDMLSIQRQFIKAWKGTDQAFYDINGEINNYSECRDAANLAKQYFEETTMRYGFKGLSRMPADPKQIQFLKERIDHLHDEFEKTSSATVGYYYYFLLVEFYQVQNNLEEASDSLSKLAQMLENNPAIKRKVRLASVHLNLGANDLWLHRFDQSRTQFETSLTYIRENTRNHGVITELLFYSLFYSGNLDEAENKFETLVDSKYVDQSDFRKAIRSYLLACVSFAKGEFRKVNLRLASSHHIGKDKEGWNIGSRVLSIMLAIEREKFDLADTLIVNLRQFQREGVEETDLRFRDTLILSILLDLRKKSYDFSEVFKLKEGIISELAEDNYETGWILQTPEMICFHTWFLDKLNERPYQPNYSKGYIYIPTLASK
jgi:tetratricopeptide (TPR) repeat protein